jgi:hypothetical protein
MTDEHIDVDARISDLAEMVYRVISDREMLRAEKVREVERLVGRMLQLDAQRPVTYVDGSRDGMTRSLDVLADALAAPGAPDCPGCGAPHGYPPAGPCAEHDEARATS